MNIEKIQIKNENKFEDNLFKLFKNDGFKKLINNAVEKEENFDFEDLKEELLKAKEEKKKRKYIVNQKRFGKIKKLNKEENKNEKKKKNKKKYEKSELSFDLSSENSKDNEIIKTILKFIQFYFFIKIKKITTKYIHIIGLKKRILLFKMQ